jgi:hypothetical protein
LADLSRRPSSKLGLVSLSDFKLWKKIWIGNLSGELGFNLDNMKKWEDGINEQFQLDLKHFNYSGEVKMTTLHHHRDLFFICIERQNFRARFGSMFESDYEKTFGKKIPVHGAGK